MKTFGKTTKIGCLILLVVGIGMFVWIVSNAVPLMKYSQRSRRINDTIRSLEQRRPANVDAELWQECIAWASTAHGNICFSEGHTSYSSMCRFEEQLDEKLKEEVDIDTIEWIGERLAETGPNGQQYMTKWQKQWQAILDHFGKKEEPQVE